jgi:hypothetical protein
MKLSSDNRLIKTYRWFKRRQHAIDRNQAKAFKEHDATRENGAQINICPIVRMVLLWGPFLVFPSWVARYILFPIGMGALAFSLFGGLGMMMLTEMGFLGVPTSLFGAVLGAFLGLLFIVACFAGLILFMFILSKFFESASDGIRAMRRQKTEKTAGAEVRATPVIGAWLQAFHDKFCPTATIVVEAQA